MHMDPAFSQFQTKLIKLQIAILRHAPCDPFMMPTQLAFVWSALLARLHRTRLFLEKHQVIDKPW